MSLRSAAVVGSRLTPLRFSMLVTVAAAIVAPWGSHEVGPHVGFLPAALTVVACFDLLSASLLVQQFRAEGDARSLGMAGAYTWSLVVMLGYAGAFPGVVSTQPPLATAPSVAPWLYVIWHTSFPVLLALSWAPWPHRFAADRDPERRGRWAWGTQVAALIGAGALVAVVVAAGPDLPVVIRGVDTTRMTDLTAPVTLPIVAISAIATAWAVRRRTGPERWTSAAVWVCLVDLGLTYAARHRYSTGWYAGHLLTVVAAGVVLVAMLRQSSRLRTEREDLVTQGHQDELLQRTILGNLSVGVILTDLNGIVMMINDAGREMFSDVRAGQPVVPLVITDVSGQPIADRDLPTARTIRTGEAQRDVVIVVTMPSGHRVWMSVNTTPVPSPGGLPAAVLASYVDVTEREQARRDLEETGRHLEAARDAALAATEAKSGFLATMSHEIRTPMNAVIGMTGLLLDTELNAEQTEFAETVRDSGDALLLLINDILDFSRIESGDFELDEHPFELRDCVESACALLALAADSKGLELVADFEPGCPAAVVGDVTRFRQVIVNLLANAVKFTAAGEVVVTIGAPQLPADAEVGGSVRLRVSVRDTGIGIPADRMHRLFHSFSQVDSSTTRVYGGTGLGLAISRQLAQAMGGDVLVTSEVGVGSTFTFTAVVRTCVERRAELGPPGGTLAGATVLMVDDNATNRRVLSVLLRSWGIVCTEVATPAEALARLAAGSRFDVGVLDMHMPEMDGQQLATALRALPAGRDLPLILLTSLQSHLAAEHRALFAAMLTKPVKRSVLHERLLAAVAPAKATLAAIETAGGRRRHDGPILAAGAVTDSRAVDSLGAAPSRNAAVVAPVGGVGVQGGSAERTGGAGRSLRVLLAEDNPVNQRVAQMMLTKLGHRVDTVANGLEAVMAVHRVAYDAILMDVQMPEMDGLAATEIIRSELPAARQPTILALTASVLAEDRAACARAGMDACLAKPIRTDELRAVLDDIQAQPSNRSRSASTP